MSASLSAVYGNHYDIAEALITAGADIYATDFKGRSFQYHTNRPMLELGEDRHRVRLLMGDNPKNGLSAANIALRFGHNDIAGMLAKAQMGK